MNWELNPTDAVWKRRQIINRFVSSTEKSLINTVSATVTGTAMDSYQFLITTDWKPELPKNIEQVNNTTGSNLVLNEFKCNMNMRTMSYHWPER